MKIKMLGLLSVLFVPLCSPCCGQIYDTNGDYVQTFAGSGFSGLLNGQGTQTMFNGPRYIVSDTFGNLFVGDYGNGVLRKITHGGSVSTFAAFSSGPPYPFIGPLTIDHSNTLYALITLPPYSSASLCSIGINGSISYISLAFGFYEGSMCGLCADSTNNIYIADCYANLIYRYRPGVGIAVFAGSGNSGEVDGNGIFSSFNYPCQLAADAADNIYVADDVDFDSQFSIRRIDQNQNVVTVVFPSRNPFADGQNPSISGLSGMCVDSFGNLILACDSCVRKLSVTTNAVTMAGCFSQGVSAGTGFSNGFGSNALFNFAADVCFSQGMVFVADTGNQRIRCITNNPQPQVVSGANLAIATFAGLTISGAVGRTYQVQTSPDMNSWSTVATFLLTSCPYLWIDQNPLAAHKFYRALLLP